MQNFSRLMMVMACVGTAGIVQSARAADSPTSSLSSSPDWIWTKNSAAGEVRFERSFTLDRSLQQGELNFAADFCWGRIEINGRRVLEVAPYCQRQTLDVTSWLQRGENKIAIVCSAVPGPPAVALSLVVRHPVGEPTILLTDGQWSNAADLGSVPPEFWGVGRRGIGLSPFENYEQWQQAKTDAPKKRTPQFWTVPGFEVTELRTAAADEGSWISLTFDDKGQALIAREDQGFLRMTLDAGRKSVSRVEAISSELKECRGLVFEDGWLYANANNSLGLFQFQIDEQGKVQKQKQVWHLPGKVGHGRNDLAVTRGPAPRWLYSIQGDSVEFGDQKYMDWTSPLGETHRKGPGREGFLLGMNPLQGTRELICAGLRNPYGIDLHETGDPFTFDADNEHDMGTPWYRPTRILHLIPGGDFGYRESTGILPPRFHDQPDHAPPLLDIGRSSPTAVMFGYDLKFPQPYRNSLFALDWTYGRVLAIHLSPRGATYRAAAELFLQGRPLNVTDIAAGPDGEMYLITGGRKTQSALYRVGFRGKEHAQKSLGTHEQQAAAYSAEVRGKASLSLDVADPVQRHAARINLEKTPLPEWRSRVLDANPPDWCGLLALARARRIGDVRPILTAVEKGKLAELNLTQQFVWLRILNLCWETSNETVETRRTELIAELLSLAKVIARDEKLGTEFRVCPEGTSDELRRRVVYLLADLQARDLPTLAAEQLLRSSKQEDQLAALLALRNLKESWTLDPRREQFRVLNDIPRMVGGAGLPPFEKWLRPQVLKTLTPAEEVALAELIDPAKDAAEEAPPPPRKVVQKWTLDELSSLHKDDATAGNPTRGATIFRDALCSRCHRVNLRGAAVGPDLTHVSRRFSRRDVLESILTPSLSVAESFRTEQVLTVAGQVYSGRIVNEGDYRSEKLILALDPLQPDKIVELDKKDIAEHRTTQTSPMPNGLLDTFTLEEIRDLLAYLEAGL